MSRYRLLPTPDLEAGLVEHCRQARFVCNLAVEQQAHWRPGRAPAPNYNEHARQLTEARAEFAWLRAGSVTVQQQALRDFAQAMRNLFAGTHRKPSWRKAGRDEGFRQVAVRPEHVQKLNRNMGRVCVAISAALSTGELLTVPGLKAGERQRLRCLQRRLARCQRASNRRKRLKAAIAKLKARKKERRKDWAEKTTTDLARRFDLIRVEDLKIRGMTRSARGTAEKPGTNVRAKAGLNRGILANGWGQLVARPEHKAPSRVEKINAARNIAAGRAVTARGALQPIGGAANREPQPATSTA